MAGTGPKLGSHDAIAAHAQKLVDKAIADGKIAPDSNAAVAAAAVPSFSSGTIALDPNTNRPIVPDSVAETPALPVTHHIDPNATGALGAPDAETGAAAEAAAAGRAGTPPQQRGDDGRFAPAQAPAADQQPARPAAQPAPATAEQRADAADAAAAAVLDEWADAVEIPFEHDTGERYTVRAKKSEAKQIERFNRRQAIVDRHAGYLDRARPVLEPLITEGRLEPLLPVLQRAIADREFADFVGQAYNRRISGQPLNVAQPAAPVPAPAQPTQFPAQASPAAKLQIPEIADPYIAETMAPVFAALQQQFQEQLAARDGRLDTWEQQQRAQAQAQQRAQAQTAANAEQVRLAHMDLTRQYPGEFTGDPVRDDRALQPIFRYARDAGYVREYGPRAGVVLAAQALARERADTGSPAAEMIAAVDRTTLAAAGSQAAAARSVAGSGAAVQPPRRATPQPPSIYLADGKTRKNPKQYMAEMQAYQAQMLQLQGQTA